MAGSPAIHGVMGCVCGVGCATKSHHWVSVCVLCSCFIKEEVYTQEIVTSKFLFGEGPTCPQMLSWTRTQQAV